MGGDRNSIFTASQKLAIRSWVDKNPEVALKIIICKTICKWVYFRLNLSKLKTIIDTNEIKNAIIIMFNAVIHHNSGVKKKFKDFASIFYIYHSIQHFLI